MTDGATPRLDRALGERRPARRSWILLALPGSAYIYQGDELGLQEVADLPREVLEDPMASRTTKEKGRDGCRVPLPWSADGPSYGFGQHVGHLPQPEWFAAYAVDVQEADPGSMLNLYRRALALRSELLVSDDLHWVESESSVLHFARPGGVRCITNFWAAPVALPVGEILLSSGQLDQVGCPATRPFGCGLV